MKSSRVGDIAFIAQCGSNGHERFLTVVEYGGGGPRGFVVIPEGRGGRGWRGFVVELRMFLEYFQSSHGVGRRVNLARSSHSGYPSSGLGVSSSVLLLQVLAWSIGRRSYAKVLVVSGSPRKTLQGLECLPVFPRCKIQMYGWLKEW